jgi:hypothetical protein
MKIEGSGSTPKCHGPATLDKGKSVFISGLEWKTNAHTDPQKKRRCRILIFCCIFMHDKSLKGQSHEMDLAFQDMHCQF